MLILGIATLLYPKMSDAIDIDSKCQFTVFNVEKHITNYEFDAVIPERFIFTGLSDSRLVRRPADMCHQVPSFATLLDAVPRFHIPQVDEIVSRTGAKFLTDRI